MSQQEKKSSDGFQTGTTQSAGGAATAALLKRERAQKFFTLYQKFGIVVVFLLVFILASAVTGGKFLQVQNLLNVINQNVTYIIMACGMTILIIAGYIDLSGGTVLAMSGCLTVGVAVSTESLVLGLVVGIGSAMLINYISGTLITKFNLPPFIATLAMMNVANGILQIYTNGISVRATQDFMQPMVFLGGGRIGMFPFPVIPMLGFLLITWVMLKKTKFGLYAYAIGGNKNAAIASGIHVNRMTRLFYLFHGMMVGIAAVFIMGRLKAGMPSVGTGYEFDAITAVVVGGTSFTGGVGSVAGSLVGALIVGIINNVLTLNNVPTSYQFIVKGLLIAGAVMLDLKTRENAKV